MTLLHCVQCESECYLFFFGFADAVADVSLLWLLVADVDIIRYGFGSLVMPRDVTATKSGRWGKPPPKFSPKHSSGLLRQYLSRIVEEIRGQRAA